MLTTLNSELIIKSNKAINELITELIDAEIRLLEHEDCISVPTKCATRTDELCASCKKDYIETRRKYLISRYML